MAGKCRDAGTQSKQNIHGWEVDTVPPIYWKNSSARTYPHTTVPMLEGHWWAWPYYRIYSSKTFWNPMVILFPSAWGHVDTWSPPILFQRALRFKYTRCDWQILSPETKAWRDSVTCPRTFIESTAEMWRKFRHLTLGPAPLPLTHHLRGKILFWSIK